MGFVGMSIVDHDSIEAYDEGCLYAADQGLIFLPGVEISAKCRDEPIHVLGYSFDPHSSIMLEACLTHRRRREVRNQKILDNLAREGLKVAMEEVIARSPITTTYGRPHMALVMVDKGYVPDVASAFRLYLAKGKRCYAEGEKWTVSEAIEVIHGARGLAVLAHPHLIKAGFPLEQLLSHPFDGIEAYYGTLGPFRHRPWCEIAQRSSLFVTGGSDFHGSVKPEHPFGSSWAPEETLDLLHKHFLSL
jgi:predicted metal-dependent phosphoesterase TrpH